MKASRGSIQPHGCRRIVQSLAAVGGDGGKRGRKFRSHNRRSNDAKTPDPTVWQRQRHNHLALGGIGAAFERGGRQHAG